MASGITPSQERAVDPFASYNSNTVNRLTNMMTRGYRGLPTIYDLQVTQDGSQSIKISGGWCIKDDVLIEVTDSTTEMQVLGTLASEDNYAHSFDYLSAENGYYYVVLEYLYAKSRPAPTARFKIISEAHNSAYQTIIENSGSSYVLLKILHVVSDVITEVLDFDPTSGRTDNVREYLPTIMGAVNPLPIFDPLLHTGRIVYDIAADVLKYGGSSDWKVVGVGSTNKQAYDITAPGDWSLVGGIYRNDTSVLGLGLGDRTASITCKDNATHNIIIPYKAVLTTASNCRIEMPVNTVSVGVTVIG